MSRRACGRRPVSIDHTDLALLAWITFCLACWGAIVYHLASGIRF